MHSFCILVSVKAVTMLCLSKWNSSTSMVQSAHTQDKMKLSVEVMLCRNLSLELIMSYLSSPAETCTDLMGHGQNWLHNLFLLSFFQHFLAKKSIGIDYWCPLPKYFLPLNAVLRFTSLTLILVLDVLPFLSHLLWYFLGHNEKCIHSAAFHTARAG